MLLSQNGFGGRRRKTTQTHPATENPGQAAFTYPLGPPCQEGRSKCWPGDGDAVAEKLREWRRSQNGRTSERGKVPRHIRHTLAYPGVCGQTLTERNV